MVYLSFLNHIYHIILNFHKHKGCVFCLDYREMILLSQIHFHITTLSKKFQIQHIFIKATYIHMLHVILG